MSSVATSERSTSRPSYLRAASRLLVGQGLVLLVAMAANLASARVLGATGRGEVAMVLQSSYVLVTLVILGRDRALTVAAIDPPPVTEPLADQLALSRAALWWSLPASVVVTQVAFGFSLRSLLVAALLGGLVVLGVAMRMSRAGAILIADSGPFLRRVVAGQVMLGAAVVVLYVLHVDTSTMWISAYLLGGLPLVVPYLRQGRQQLDAASRAGVRRRGVGVLPTSVAEILLLRFERLLLPLMASFSSLGVYVAIATMTELASWPAQQYADAKSPTWTREGLSSDLVRRDFGISMLVSIGCAVPLGVVAWVALEPLFGPEFAAGGSLVPPLVLASVGTALYRVVFAMSISADQPAVGRVLTLSGFLAALVVYPLAIWLGGAVGAAWGSAAGLLGSALVGYVTLSVRIGRRDAAADDRRHELVGGSS